MDCMLFIFEIEFCSCTHVASFITTFNKIEAAVVHMQAMLPLDFTFFSIKDQF